METSYASVNSGGFFEESLIPNLERLANDKNNIHFTHKPEKLGGPKEMKRMSYTSGATYAILCGDYLGRPVGGSNKYFRPELKYFTDILKENGYNLVAIYPTSYYSCNQGYLYLSHSMKRTDLIDSLIMKKTDDWISDYIMIDHAKKAILRKYQENRPFMAIMMTMDTHFPGFHCKYCNKTGNKLYDAIRCSDQQISSFVEWVNSQSFYENTTIIIHRDHKYMGNKMNIDRNYDRRVFNLVINPKTQRTGKITKDYALFDMFPTLLSLAGAKIKGEKLGLGTNLLSNEPNLLNKYPFEYINKETTRENIWFNTFVLKRPPPGEIGFSLNLIGYNQSSSLQATQKSNICRRLK